MAKYLIDLGYDPLVAGLLSQQVKELNESTNRINSEYKQKSEESMQVDTNSSAVREDHFQRRYETGNMNLAPFGRAFSPRHISLFPGYS